MSESNIEGTVTITFKILRNQISECHVETSKSLNAVPDNVKKIVKEALDSVIPSFPNIK